MNWFTDTAGDVIERRRQKAIKAWRTPAPRSSPQTRKPAPRVRPTVEWVVVEEPPRWVWELSDRDKQARKLRKIWRARDKRNRKEQRRREFEMKVLILSATAVIIIGVLVIALLAGSLAMALILRARKSE